MSVNQLLTRTIEQTSEKPLGTVIFLHGSLLNAGRMIQFRYTHKWKHCHSPGDSGDYAEAEINSELGEKWAFPHLKILYPTAPPRPYTPMMGQLSNVWYDRRQISPAAPDDDSIDTMATSLVQLVEAEIQMGIPADKIIIGGFSMGGGMTLHLGYRYTRDVAGVFALSSFLSSESKVFEALQSESSPKPPLFQAHGEADELIQYDWGKQTFEKLRAAGVSGQFHSIPGLDHEMDKHNILQLVEWIHKLIPQP